MPSNGLGTHFLQNFKRSDDDKRPAISSRSLKMKLMNSTQILRLQNLNLVDAFSGKNSNQ